ncbi:hypothetical protein [Oceanirhabdus sp. W0125-5]|uniref:hypothetical protein n=1 Tax=Oceanirhabdus sp. W0125-5 TaxID=2999116 RepID=UPI0022F32A4B|nr:hypothetical protein [Oceanirhabdus sp. W0125-5]WBW95943.1 hypothetical protein OW730_19955 [Oceanirhabdus sp. W0125-5]
MGINAYATKEFENEEYVVYSYGSQIDNQTGKIRFNKETLELLIIEKENDVNRSRELFKIASKIESIYTETGMFPEKAFSAS